ncbi:hypothetical protein SK128_019869, partial [Halocaridina rubra]
LQSGKEFANVIAQLYGCPIEGLSTMCSCGASSDEGPDGSMQKARTLISLVEVFIHYPRNLIIAVEIIHKKKEKETIQ